MSIRSHVLAVACLVALAGSAQAQPGTAYLQVRGGALVPVGSFADQQDAGGAYSVAAGYEPIDFLGLELEFTQSFNDNVNDRVSGPGFTIISDEVKQNFVVGLGPRVTFLPSDYPVRPFGVLQAEWYHFANFNSVEVDGSTILSDDDEDAAGLEAGLGIEGTVFSVYERSGDEVPMLELTLGAQASYHHAFMPNRDDRQFVTAMGSLGLRF